ncbi:aldehyde dehydrogenase family protein [Nocardia halotolerans]|uniref:Aldehyde dehydrogenase family protein n=1 Tax=Nocardia halotolerans TaxID=1755878 RepID=A0ABV8VPY9_9NOCA
MERPRVPSSEEPTALLAGNAVVQKPDIQTALTALWALDLMTEAGLPAGVWQMVLGRGSSIGESLMNNADYMMFTGSTDVTPEMTLYDEETFGPVVSIYAFGDDEEAIERANATAYGLNASVWSRNGGRARAVAARVRTGTVNVNDAYAAAWGSVDAPMGGMGDSGLGRRHGADGLLKYTEAQTVAHQRLLGFSAPVGLSESAWAQTLTIALKTMKRIGAR